MSAATKQFVYALITPARVRFYFSHARAIAVWQRAKRMGLTVDFTGDYVRSAR